MLHIQEKILINRAQRGDQNAFAKLYNEYIGQIQRFVFFKVSNRDKAEELTNTIFFKTLNYLLKGEEIDNFRALLYKIARTSIIDFYRANAKSDIFFEEVPEKEIDEEADLDKKIDVKLDLEKIQEALTKIPENYRQVLVLRFVNELSFKEIAKITGQDEANLRQIVSRGLKLLRHELNSRGN